MSTQLNQKAGKVAEVKTDLRLQRLEEERIPGQITRVIDGNPELDYLIALSTDYVLEAQEYSGVDLQKVEAALQLIQQAYRLEAHMYAQETGTIEMPLGSTHEELDVYTLPRRSHKVWEMGYYFGIICRSRHLQSDFRILPYTRQFMQNNIFDEFRTIYYHFLRQLETPQMPIFLRRSEEVLTKIPMAFAAHYNSYVPLWRPVLERNEAKLHVMLKEIMEFREAFNTHNQIETMLPLIAILSYAHDLGLKFDAYDLPMDLITGKYAVEIDERLDYLFGPAEEKQAEAAKEKV